MIATSSLPVAYVKRLERLEQRRVKPDNIPADPVALALALGIEPTDWQADVMRSRDRRLLLNAHPASGGR